MKKNVASQIVIVFAWDTANGVPKTGDSGNITAQISKDGGAAAGTNTANPTEIDAANMKGLYYFPLLQEETNCDVFALSPVSGTADIDLEPVVIHTTDDAALVTEIDANETKIDTLTTNVGNLENLSAAQAETACDSALATYDAPTKTEMDNKIDALDDVTAAQVNAQCDQALTDYDAATGTELAATEAKIDLLQIDSTRILGMLFENAAWEYTYTNQKQTGGKIYLYDTAGHAATNDHTTGLVGELTVVIAVNGNGDPTSMKITKVS